MQGEIDTSFQTVQRDLFESGMAAQIGMLAFGLWSAIKAHAEYSTGLAWPSIRRLMELTGLASATVQKCIDILEKNLMIRKVVQANKTFYVARERIDVRVGERVLCTIVVDYVPNQLRGKLNRIQQALKTGENDQEAFADVDIVPGKGFTWDAKTGTLRAAIPASDFPADENAAITDPMQEKIRLLEANKRLPHGSKKRSSK
jgi:DNA-binding transcriptional regulator YhcF (GntR family)